MDVDPVDQVVASARLEGASLPDLVITEMRRYAAGEICYDELVRRTDTARPVPIHP